MGRVAVGIAPHSSRRSGLAQLRHPARLAMDSRALCYLAALRLQHPGLNVPDLLPTANSTTRRPLPSTGSPTHRFPCPQRYYEALRPPADHPAALRCLRLAVPSRAPVFAPLRPDAGLGPGTFRIGCPSAPIVIETEPQGLPGSQAALLDLCRVLRPRRDR